jgi:hypothetical protein
VVVRLELLEEICKRRLLEVAVDMSLTSKPLNLLVKASREILQTLNKSTLFKINKNRK